MPFFLHCCFSYDYSEVRCKHNIQEQNFSYYVVEAPPQYDRAPCFAVPMVLPHALQPYFWPNEEYGRLMTELNLALQDEFKARKGNECLTVTCPCLPLGPKRSPWKVVEEWNKKLRLTLSYKQEAYYRVPQASWGGGGSKKAVLHMVAWLELKPPAGTKFVLPVVARDVEDSSTKGEKNLGDRIFNATDTLLLHAEAISAQPGGVSMPQFGGSGRATLRPKASKDIAKPSYPVSPDDSSNPPTPSPDSVKIEKPQFTPRRASLRTKDEKEAAGKRKASLPDSVITGQERDSLLVNAAPIPSDDQDGLGIEFTKASPKIRPRSKSVAAPQKNEYQPGSDQSDYLTMEEMKIPDQPPPPPIPAPNRPLSKPRPPPLSPVVGSPATPKAQLSVSSISLECSAVPAPTHVFSTVEVGTVTKCAATDCNAPIQPGLALQCTQCFENLHHECQCRGTVSVCTPSRHVFVDVNYEPPPKPCSHCKTELLSGFGGPQCQKCGAMVCGFCMNQAMTEPCKPIPKPNPRAKRTGDEQPDSDGRVSVASSL